MNAIPGEAKIKITVYEHEQGEVGAKLTCEFIFKASTGDPLLCKALLH